MTDDFHGQEYFLTTHWSVVLDAQRHSDSTRASNALARLCQTYWYPLYAYVRRTGQGPEDAQDLTQEFFRRLVGMEYLKAVDPARGKFRSFLLSALKHFLANEWDRSRALKRGGGKPLISLDDTEAEARYALEPVENSSPDKVYERRWATTLLDHVLARLRKEYSETGKENIYEQLKQTLTFESVTAPYADIAARLEMSEGAVKVAVHRLRARYRELLREEIAQTVTSAADVEEEIRFLFTVLSR